MEWLRRRQFSRRKSLSFRDQTCRLNTQARQFCLRRLGPIRMAVHRQVLRGLMLRHPQSAHLFGVAANTVAVGSRAADHRWSVTLVTTSCLVRATFVPSRPVPKCTPVPMLCRLLNPILDLTHQKFIRAQLVPIRGNGKAALGKAGAEISFSPCRPTQAAALLRSSPSR
jgi:hypothetical protein